MTKYVMKVKDRLSKINPLWIPVVCYFLYLFIDINNPFDREESPSKHTIFWLISYFIFYLSVFLPELKYINKKILAVIPVYGVYVVLSFLPTLSFFLFLFHPFIVYAVFRMFLLDKKNGWLYYIIVGVAWASITELIYFIPSSFVPFGFLIYYILFFLIPLLTILFYYFLRVIDQRLDKSKNSNYFNFIIKYIVFNISIYFLILLANSVVGFFSSAYEGEYFELTSYLFLEVFMSLVALVLVFKLYIDHLLSMHEKIKKPAIWIFYLNFIPIINLYCIYYYQKQLKNPLGSFGVYSNKYIRDRVNGFKLFLMAAGALYLFVIVYVTFTEPITAAPVILSVLSVILLLLFLYVPGMLYFIVGYQAIALVLGLVFFDNFIFEAMLNFAFLLVALLVYYRSMHVFNEKLLKEMQLSIQSNDNITLRS